MKKKLIGTGILLAVVGILGKFLAEDYLGKHAVKGVMGSVVGKLGGNVPWETQLALLFNEYGLIVAGVGVAIFAVGFLAKR